MSSVSPPSPERSRFRFFAPILAGATWRDRLVACAGALVCVGATGLICGLLLGNDPHLPLLVAPMGASALLLFAIPSSPLAQPWPIVGGNTVSALIGLLISRYVPEPAVAAGCAVALAIAAMSLLRCLHPPGGAAALTAALGGPAVATYGLGFAFIPVGLNALVLTLLGIDRENRVLGTVGLRELAHPCLRVRDVMSPAVIARPNEPAVDLLAMLLRPLRREAA